MQRCGLWLSIYSNPFQCMLFIPFTIRIPEPLLPRTIAAARNKTKHTHNGRLQHISYLYILAYMYKAITDTNLQPHFVRICSIWSTYVENQTLPRHHHRPERAINRKAQHCSCVCVCVCVVAEAESACGPKWIAINGHGAHNMTIHIATRIIYHASH